MLPPLTPKRWIGRCRERLQQSGELEKLLNWQKSNLVTIAVPVGDSTIYTEARLAFRTDENGNIGLAVHSMRKEPQLDYPYMGYKFSPEEKEQPLTTDNLGKTIEVTPKNGEPFSAYVSIDQRYSFKSYRNSVSTIFLPIPAPASKTRKSLIFA